MSQGTRTRVDLQELRGIAVILVVAYHSGLRVPGGFFGVDVFMVLSGFVITQMLLHEFGATGTISLRSFYTRRARRLLPALGLVVVTVSALSVFILSPHDPQQLAFKTGVSAESFVANIYLYRQTGYFDASAAMNPFLHLWSLSVEEQIYLVLPLLALLAIKAVGVRRPGTENDRPSHSLTSALSRVRRSIIVIASVGSAVSFFVAIGLSRQWFDLGFEAPGRLAFFAAPTRFWEFGAGIVLASVDFGSTPTARGVRRWLKPLGLAGLAIAAWYTDPGAPHPDLWTLVPVGATAMIIASGPAPERAPHRVFARPLQWIGDRSYAWYLWHWPAIVFAKVLWPTSTFAPLIAAIIALGPAMVSTARVEMPIRFNSAIVGRKALKLSTLCVLVPIGLLAMGQTMKYQNLGLNPKLGWTDSPLAHELGCNHFNHDGVATWSADLCTTHVDGSTGTVFVVGDQNADSMYPAVVTAAKQLQMDTAVWTRSGCPFSDAHPVHSPKCVEWNADVWKLIGSLKPKVVIVSNHSLDYTADPRSEVALQTASGGHPASSEQAKTMWEKGLHTTLARLGSQNAGVVLIGDIPDYGPAFPSGRYSLVDPSPVAPTLDRSVVDQRHRAIIEMERHAVSELPHAVYLDPIPTLCSEVCSPERASGSLYYDRNHLSMAGSALLVTPILDAIEVVRRSR